MKIAVTGAAGFVGCHLTQALVVAGHHVRAIDNLYNGDWARLKHVQLKEDDVQRLTIDVRDLESLRKAFEGVEAVFHLAALSNVMRAIAHPDYLFSTNILGTYNVCEAARLAGVRRILYTSSREVYGEPDQLPVAETAPTLPKNAYGYSKLAGEVTMNAFANTGSFEAFIVRLANVYGSQDQGRVIPIFLERAQRGEPLILYGGEQIIDFIWVGDVVAALISLLDRPNWPDRDDRTFAGPLNIGSGIGTSIRTLAERICSLAGTNSFVQIHPARQIEVKNFVADVSLARQVLNLPIRSDPLEQLAGMLMPSAQER